MEHFGRKSSGTATEPRHVVCGLCTAAPCPAFGSSCMSVWRFHGVPGAEDLLAQTAIQFHRLQASGLFLRPFARC